MSDQKDRDKATQPLSSSSSSSSLGNQQASNDVWNNPRLLRLDEEIDSVAAEIKTEKGKLEDLCAQRRQAVIDEKVQLGQLLAEDIDKLEQSIAGLNAKENKLLEQRDRLTQSLSGNTVQFNDHGLEQVNNQIADLKLFTRRELQKLDSKVSETRYMTAKGSTSFAEEWANLRADEIMLNTFFALFSLGQIQKTSTSVAFSQDPEAREGRDENENMVLLKDNPLECAFQDYVMSQLLLLERRPISVKDTSATPYLDGRKPDVSGVHSNVLSALYCVFVAEVKRKGNFSPSALGELVTFLKRIICVQPNRRHVVGFLTDGFEVVFVGLVDSQVKYTPRLSLDSNGIGRLALISFFKVDPSDLGWEEIKMPTECLARRLLGTGSTSSIYAVCQGDEDDESAIVKVCKAEEVAQYETSVLSDLNEGGCLHIPSVVNREVNMIVLTPLGTRFTRTEMPCAIHFLQLIGTLETAHQLGYIHRDLRPENWLRSEGSLLIDWGFASRRNETKKYSGTLSFASVHVLEHLIEQKHDLVVEPEDDLESFVRIAFYFVTGRRPVYEDDMTPLEKAQVSIDFWKRQIELNFWHGWVVKARQKDYEGLKQLAQCFGVDYP